MTKENNPYEVIEESLKWETKAWLAVGLFAAAALGPIIWIGEREKKNLPPLPDPFRSVTQKADADIFKQRGFATIGFNGVSDSWGSCYSLKADSVTDYGQRYTGCINHSYGQSRITWLNSI